MSNLIKGVPVENVNAGTVHLKRFPAGYKFLYYMEIKGVNIRIAKTLYRDIKRAING